MFQYPTIKQRNYNTLSSYRPSIADKVRIGFFSQDRYSQTETTEILPMKEMQEVMGKLVTVSILIMTLLVASDLKSLQFV